MVNIQEAPSWVWAIVLLVIFAAIGVLVLEEIRSSSGWAVNETTEGAVIQNATFAINNVTKQLPTVGIVVGVTLIIGAVILIAVYFGNRNYS